MISALPKRPQYVTRFYGNVDYALDVIANQQITFVHASALNDPFDPYFFLETDFGEDGAHLLNYIRENHPRDEALFKPLIMAASLQQSLKEIREKLLSWRKSTFVFSTSAECEGMHPRDNLYMWGHYGNGHRGVAIEFDTECMATSVLEYHKTINQFALEPQEVMGKIIV